MKNGHEWNGEMEKKKKSSCSLHAESGAGEKAEQAGLTLCEAPLMLTGSHWCDLALAKLKAALGWLRDIAGDRVMLWNSSASLGPDAGNKEVGPLLKQGKNGLQEESRGGWCWLLPERWGKWTLQQVDRETVLHGASLFPPILQVTEILTVINTCQDFSLFTVKSSWWGFMPAGSAGKIFRVLEKKELQRTLSPSDPQFSASAFHQMPSSLKGHWQTVHANSSHAYRKATPVLKIVFFPNI